MHVKLDQLKFDNRFVNELPGDPDLTNSRRQVAEACYSRALPTKVIAPKVVAYSREVAELIGLDPAEGTSDQFASVFGGNQLLDGMDPFAMCYGGHQFGNWAGQLGDGRAINLGEVVKPVAGENIDNSASEHWTLQLKGAGPTPYSRTADGLAVLRSSIREFLCSEAMFHLGVPTTRALSLVATGEQVMRDMFYDGNPKYEPGAVVCRVAPSFVRFGNFQIFAARGDVENLKRLVDFTIRNDFPHLGEPSPEVYAKWYEEVCLRTCDMIVHWMRVGFVHGVMNTDNMSILGLTIDYGPYGWLEDYDPGWTPNTTDASGKRYRFGNQPLVAHWNLYQLGNAILPLVNETEPLQNGLDVYLEKIESDSNAMMAGKLGLKSYNSTTDDELKKELFEVLTLTETDMTIFYRKLANISTDGSDDDSQQSDTELFAPVMESFYEPEEITAPSSEEQIANRKRIADWLRSYKTRLRIDGVADDVRREKMNRTNPKYVLRNYVAQLAIDKAESGDGSMVMELLEILRNPYDEQPDQEEFAAKRPEWARHRAGCSMLSCSS
ncbi:MAG: YdiU family protein [Mariniblastus sp.]